MPFDLKTELDTALTHAADHARCSADLLIDEVLPALAEGHVSDALEWLDQVLSDLGRAREDLQSLDATERARVSRGLARMGRAE